MTGVDDSVKAYRQAERRLREVLLGDGSNTVGAVKGEERRLEVTRLLRRMRDASESMREAFQAVAEQDADRAKEAEARLADLEDALSELLARARHESKAA